VVIVSFCVACHFCTGKYSVWMLAINKRDATYGNCWSFKTCVCHTCLDLILALYVNTIPVNLYFWVLFLHDVYFSFCEVGEFAKARGYLSLVSHFPFLKCQKNFKLALWLFVKWREIQWCMFPVKYIVTCWVVHATNMTGSSSDDWIY
jgi:hypothetical protein